MRIDSLRRTLVLLVPLLLGGCAANQLHGFQNAYQGYNVPESLVARIRTELGKNGLPNAQVTRDNVGRIRLTGSYRNEDEVDLAFVIVQSIVGMKSTSPFYPDNIQEKRWELEAKVALERHAKMLRDRPAPAVKRALIVGINNFYDGNRLKPIMGEDDAKLVKSAAEKAGYQATDLLGPKATKKNIEETLERFKRELGPNDSLLIYISSHGNQPIPSHQGGDARKMSIAAYDSGNPDFRGLKEDYKVILHKTSVPDTKVQELARMPTKQTRVIIDTCYSGEILKDIPDESARYILETNGGVPERAGISMAAWGPSNYVSKGLNVVGDKTSAPTKSKPSRPVAPPASSVPSDINRYTIITATSDGEESWGPDQGRSFASPVNPGKQLQGSFFTQTFFEYLDKYGGHLEPAFKDARTFTATKVAQDVATHPQFKNKGPISQTPRLNPPLPTGDSSNLYQ